MIEATGSDSSGVAATAREGAMPSGRTAEAVTGLSVTAVDALRYDGQTDDRWESTGILLSMIPEGSRVLDVGCGTGSISCLIRDKRSADVVGLEPNADRARRTAERGITVEMGTFSEDVVRRHGTFDVVLFADVLEHLEDPAAMLRQVRGALRPRGRVLASIPNVAHWSVRLNLLVGRFDYQPTGIMDATHLRWFTRAGVARLFRDSGYRVRELRGSAGMFLPAYHASVLRFVPPRIRLGLVRRAMPVAPGLFACQHVLAAEPTD
jgi:methionine biosynthesis protein MetW